MGGFAMQGISYYLKDAAAACFWKKWIITELIKTNKSVG